MNTIRIENFRSIEDSGVVEIAPITVIVGKNSAGKSSFVRLFPLIKQTVEKRIAESMLWYGDYVDLGDFEHAVGRKKSDHPIVMAFSLDVEPRRYYYAVREEKDYHFNANVSIAICKKHFKYVTIEIADQIIKIEMNQDGTVSDVWINDDNQIMKQFELKWYREAGDLLPYLWIARKDETSGKNYLDRFEGDSLTPQIRKLIYGEKNHKSEVGYARRIISEVIIGEKEKILLQLKEKNEKKYGKMTVKNKQFIECNNYILTSYITFLLEEINSTISINMRQMNYIKPIRAMVDRYYRVQGISIDEVDADGSNLPMILHNMSPNDLLNFEKWCKEKFGVVFSVDSSEGHISLVIKDDVNGTEVTNLADTGYGYSQMLPIVVLLWMFHKKPSLRAGITKTIVIEQPELHLHPAYQAKLIDVFVNILKEARGKNIKLNIIFETHSEAMINRIGALISSKKLEHQWVNILVFDKENDITTVSSKTFNDKGLLKGWPIGFFAPDEVR